MERCVKISILGMAILLIAGLPLLDRLPGRPAPTRTRTHSAQERTPIGTARLVAHR